MATPGDQLLQDALDAAVMRNFGTLFEVLMVAHEGDDKSVERFQRGLLKLMNRRATISGMIESLKDNN